jgi:hypothetical protein
MLINVLVKILNAENYALLCYYAASRRNFWQTFSGQPIGPIFRGQESKSSFESLEVTYSSLPIEMFYAWFQASAAK